MARKKKYYLRLSSYSHPELDSEWKEVTQAEFVKAERAAGFHPKPGCGPVATGGFGGSDGIEGKIRYCKEEDYGLAS